MNQSWLPNSEKLLSLESDQKASKQIAETYFSESEVILIQHEKCNTKKYTTEKYSTRNYNAHVQR